MCVAMLAAVLTACNMEQLAPESVDNSATEYKNPHNLCTSCHIAEKPQAGNLLLIQGSDTSSFCLKCHKDYLENHHPVDFIPSDSSTIPLPMFAGEIRCLTCHEIHGGSRHEGTPRLLRGGPYADRREICFKCHSAEKYAAFNPHNMLDNNGNIKMENGKPVCLWCHSKKPDPAVDRTEDVRFRADVGFLCWRCHALMPINLLSQHFLIKPSAKTQQIMREAEERLLIILPLVPRGRITCSTCHNPHQKGVIQREAAAKGADAIHRLRSPSICYGCHRM